jgi:N-acetylglucosaminyldiphosphoundecaprenol N-acetyl-beta-D-mannosaminyltransferase
LATALRDPRIEARAAHPDILFVAMSSPRKEQWLGRFGESLAVPLVMGVGGAIDTVAGITRRAPIAWQQLGNDS